MNSIDEFYNKNYDRLLDYCDKYCLEHDLINDTYMKAKKLAYLTGLTEQEFFNYVRRSIWNKHRDNKRTQSRRGFNIEIKYPVLVEMDEKLREREWDEEEYNDRLNFITSMLFYYIKVTKCFTDIEVFILKSYAFTNSTYKELEQKIGISQDVCKQTMRKIRNEINNNFMKWLEDYVNKGDGNRYDE